MTGQGANGFAGRQARRQQRGHWWGLGICLVMLAFFLGLGIWMMTARPGGASQSTAAWLTALFAALGALMGGVAWFSWRKISPPAPKHVQLAVAPTELPRGGRVQATVTLTAPPAWDSEIEVALVCTERYDVDERVYNPDGPDYDQRVTREDEVYREAVRLDGHGITRTFALPPTAPFSYEGDCISAVWRIRVREHRPRRPDRFLDAPVWVLP